MIIPKTRYPGQLDETDAVGYPHGKAQNVVVEGDGTGTPFEKDLVNDILGAQQALVVAAGITPSGTPDKAGASQQLDALNQLLANMRDKSAALNWVRQIDVATDNFAGPANGKVPLCGSARASGVPVYVFNSKTDGVLRRTADLGGTIVDCTAISGPPFIVDMWADAGDTYGDILVLSDVSNVYRSTNAGDSWASPVAVGEVCTAICRHVQLGIVVVAGLNNILTIGPTLSGSFVPQTVPSEWTALTPERFKCPREGEASAGIIGLAATSTLHMLYSANGTTWVDSVLPAGSSVLDVVWSDAHGKWFAINDAGRIYSNANPAVSADWVLRCQLQIIARPRMATIGRHLVVCEQFVGPPTGEPNAAKRGQVLTTQDFETFDVANYGSDPLGPHYIDLLAYVDGRLVAAHNQLDIGTSDVLAMSFTASARSPSIRG